MAPTCPSSPGSLAVRLHVWYCPPSPHLWQANSNPSASHQTPQIDAVHQWAVRQICRKSYPPSDGSNIWSGDTTHIYTYRNMRLIMLSGSEEFCYFYFPWLCPLSSWIYLFCFCCFSMGGLDSSRAWVLPEFSSDLNFKRSPFHSFRRHQPHTPSLHQPSFFSPLTGPTISLPQRIIQHNESLAAAWNPSLCAPWGMTTTATDGDGGTGGRQSVRDGKRGKSVFNRSDKCFDFTTKACCQVPWQHSSYSWRV